MAYVRVAQSVLTHRKTLRLARLLNMDRYAVVGRLVAFWSWSLDNAPRGCLADVEPDILADVLDYDGKPAELIEAMLTAGFLDSDENGVLRVHDWEGVRSSTYEQGAMRYEWDIIAARVRPLIFERDGHVCQYCGSGDALTVDHVIPVARGGDNSFANLRTACRSCNSAKGARTPEEWQR